MSDDTINKNTNESQGTGNGTVIDFASRKKLAQEINKDTVLSGAFEFHVMNPADSKEEVIKVSGYLKFGPQFIAVVDGPEDTSNVVFAVATHLCKYVKRLDENDVIQGTLSL